MNIKSISDKVCDTDGKVLINKNGIGLITQENSSLPARMHFLNTLNKAVEHVKFHPEIVQKTTIDLKED